MVGAIGVQASGSKAFAANQHRIVEPDSFHRNRNGQFVSPLVYLRLSTCLDRSALLKRDWLKWLFATLSRLRGIWRQFRKPIPLRANSFIRTD